MTTDRPWHRVWPAHVPRSIAYPAAPAWWLLERNLPRFADRVAIRDLDHETLSERRSLTYEALFRAVRGVATGLRTLGVGRQTGVAFCLPNGVELVVGYYATWYVGEMVVPANPGARAGELEQ